MNWFKLRQKSEEAGARYVVQSPSNEIFSPTNFAKFCRDRGVSHRIIKQAFHFGDSDKRVKRGASKGWRILEISQ